MKKLVLIPLLVLLFACGSASDPLIQEAESTVGITPPVGGYEEGTWTSSVGGTAVYGSQLGSYIKIGRFVRASTVLIINSIGTGSTSVISGLPFTSSSATASSTLCALRWTNLALPVMYMVGFVDISSTQISLLSTSVSTATLTNQAVLGTTTSVTISCSYYTN